MFEFIDVKYKSIIDIPSLTIEQGKITTFTGSSGSGKTTILRMLNKMISPSEGRISYYGEDLQKVDSVFLRREISMLSQNPVVFNGSIRDNLNAGLRFQRKEIMPDSNLMQTLEQVKLNKDLDEHACNLSGGEKQRLALGRIIILNPSVFLLDEPSSALDDKTEDVIIKTIMDYSKNNNKTIVMVTHSKIIAQKYSETIFEVSEGKISRRTKFENNNCFECLAGCCRIYFCCNCNCHCKNKGN